MLNDLIQVKSSSASTSSGGEQANLLMIKAEKLNANSIVKCLKKVKSSGMCVSSSRKVASLVNRIKKFNLRTNLMIIDP